uniref:transcription elongation factor SPT5-like isoform X2 n=1 Tax=Styela clava TaxID=7725 RepID=UPI00193AA135|nr:transcription elongation factor SPT5-like isoform X2 [Styela clava]
MSIESAKDVSVISEHTEIAPQEMFRTSITDATIGEMMTRNVFMIGVGNVYHDRYSQHDREPRQTRVGNFFRRLRQRISGIPRTTDHIDHGMLDSSSAEEGVVVEDNERNVPGQSVVAEDSETIFPETPRRSGQSDNRVYNDEDGETKVKEVAAGSSSQADDRIVTDERGQTTVKYGDEGERMEIDYVDDEDRPFMTPGEEENEDTSDDNRQRPRETERGGPQVEEPQGDEQENKEEDEGTVVTVVRDDDDEHQRKAFKSREEEKKK